MIDRASGGTSGAAIDPAPHVPVVVLGLMGAGKTTLARGLAELWSRPMRDSDADLERATGSSARDIAEERGQDALHELEAAHLLDAVDTSEPRGTAPVIGAAASTIDREDCRQALHERAVTVWIDEDLELLARRQEEGEHRPRFGTDVRSMLRDMDERRRPHFAAVAHIVLTPSRQAAEAAQAEGGTVESVQGWVHHVAELITALARSPEFHLPVGPTTPAAPSRPPPEETS